MSRDYWNRVCDDYECEVVSVWDRDRAGLIRECIEGQSGVETSSQRAADLGCGVGKFLPILAERYARVEACDYAMSGLEKARSHAARFSNIFYHQVDLSLDPMPFEPVDLVLCVNVLIMHSYDDRMRAWRAVVNQVAEGGCLVLVVPALESVLMEQHMEREASLDEGESCEASLASSMPLGTKAIDLHQGVHLLEGFRTKHYFKNELEEMLGSSGFEDVKIQAIRYNSIENSKEQSDSWDWFAIAKRPAAS